MSGYQNNSIFWVETEKIGANPFQPRRAFDPKSLEDLADSIRQYGVLQPLVVTRKEEQSENGGISVFYELIAGERRLRAARLAGLEQVPVIIRKETSDKIKLELAIIENLQREDLNPIDRAHAFEQLYKEFKLTHAEIGKKMGKSRVYVSNSLRLLSLPDDMKQGLMAGSITEGHTRPLLMLSDRPEEQSTLYKEITLKKMSVRESERVARSIAQDRVRKKKFIRDPRIRDFEKRLSDNLGTRVQIEQKEKGGKITIDYFTVGDLESILNSMNKIDHESGDTMMENYVRQEQEREQEQVISKSNPINFMSGEINTSDDIKTLNNFDSVNINNLPEIKKLDGFVHNQEEEIVEYKRQLPEFEHNPQHEISNDDQFKQNLYNTNESTYGVVSNLDNNKEVGVVQDREKLYIDQNYDNENHVMWQSATENQDSNYSYKDQAYGVNTQYDNHSYNTNVQLEDQANIQHKQQENTKKKGFINRMFS